MTRIIFVCEGTEGDVNPLLSIAHHLREIGHRPTIVTQAVHAAKFGFPDSDFCSIGSPNDYAAFLADCGSSKGPYGVRDIFINHFLPWTQSAIPALFDIVSTSDNKKIVLVTNDTPGIAARTVAHYLDLPLVVVSTYPDNLRAASLVEHLVCVQLQEAIQAVIESTTGRRVPALSRWWHRYTARIALWPRWFYEQDNDPETRYVGFCWFDRIAVDGIDASGRQDHWALITGGSATLAGPNFFEPAIQGCAEASLPALIATKSALPPQLTAVANINHVRELRSMVSAIRSACVVIHHGGMGTIGPSISYGVPQVVLASGGDRTFNARCISKAGAGVAVARADWTPSRIAMELTRLDRMHNTRRGLLQVEGQLQASLEQACAAIEHALG